MADRSKTYPWAPDKKVLAEVQQYFLGFVHCGREICPRRAHICKRLRLSSRTLDRYLRYLKETGWMETVERKPRFAIRTVKKGGLGHSLGKSCGESVGGPVGESVGESQIKENPKATSTKSNPQANSRRQHRQRDDAAGTPEEQEIFELAGVRPTAANVEALRGFVSAGVPIEQIRGGVAVGRFRHIRNPAAGPIVSFHFFANPIGEAAGYSPHQLEHTIHRLKRELSRRGGTRGEEREAEVA
jgi:hypothetical protein